MQLEDSKLLFVSDFALPTNICNCIFVSFANGESEGLASH